MSYWRINVLNPGTKFGLERIRFPLLNIAPIGDAKDNVYIYPRGHGGYVKDPFNNPLGVNGYYRCTSICSSMPYTTKDRVRAST